MNRREALSSLTIVMGGAIIGAEAFLSGCGNKKTVGESGFLSKEEMNLLNEIGETILPATANSPGAKDAHVGEFMNDMVRDCYSPEEQRIFKKGLESINKRSKEEFNKDFLSLSKQERHDLLISLEEDPEVAADGKHYYKMMKQLTIWGFLTSEPGATKVLRHVDVPGRYDACIPLEKGQKAWAG